MPGPFAFAKELATYESIHAKGFLTPADQRELAELLRHEGLLSALGLRLREPARTPDLMKQQDAAIDLLFSALKRGDSKTASQALRSVVEDPQVEDSNVETSTREQLAGLKAEVLYQWSAQSPDMAQALQTWLPGPVSKKIWANVVRMQKSNLAESQAEERYQH